MNKLLRNSKIFLKKNSPTILTCIGGAGVISTSVMAVKATPKAMRLLEEAEKEKGEKLTKLEIVKTAGPIYIPSIMIGLSTIACIFGANALNKKKQASLMSAYALLDKSYREYKNKVEELYGKDANSKIQKALAKDKREENEIELEDGKELFFDCISMRYFQSTMDDVLTAEIELNRKFSYQSYASANDYYTLLGLPRLDLDDEIGWSTTAGAIWYGYSWIDFKYDKVTLDDGLECCIITPEHDPTADYI